MFPDNRRVSAGAEPFRVIQVDIRYLSGDNSNQARVVEVERRTTTAPGGKLGEDLAEVVSSYAAGEVVDAAWPTVTDHWRVTDPGRLDALATEVDNVKTLAHDMVIGRPIDQVTTTLGIPAGLGEVAAGMVPLPIDKYLDRTTMLIRFVGVIVGVATGTHPLAISCVKSIVKDAVTDVVAAGLQNAITDPTSTAVDPADLMQPLERTEQPARRPTRRHPGQLPLPSADMQKDPEDDRDDEPDQPPDPRID